MSQLTTNYLTPTGREEAWRFTPLKKLSGIHDLEVSVADNISLFAKSDLPKGVSLTTPNTSDHPPAYAASDIVTNRVRKEAKKTTLITIADNTTLTSGRRLARRRCSGFRGLVRCRLRRCGLLGCRVVRRGR